MNKGVDKKQFAKTVMGCSPSLWRQTLTGKRNLGNEQAEKAMLVLHTDKDVWRNPTRVEERVTAWKKYLEMISLSSKS